MVVINYIFIVPIELPKLIKALENKEVDKTDKLILWTLFMLSPEKLGDEDMENNEDIKKAKEELEKINQSEREKELARLRLKHIMDTKAVKQYGYEEGEKSGLEKGEKMGKLKIAKRMLELNIPIEKIIEITDLSKKEIENLY